MAKSSKEKDPTNDKKFQKVVNHFLKTPPKPKSKAQPEGGKGTDASRNSAKDR